MPELGPGQGEQKYKGDRFRLTSIMEALARADGDVEALVAVKNRDLSTPYAYLQIAEIYKQAKQADKALKWAEEGLKAFPNRPDDRLREFLADAYHRRRRHDEAMALIWAGFADRPSLETCKRLKAHADRAKQWPQWRKRALETVHKGIAEARKEARRGDRTWVFDTNHSLLVEIYLWEKDVETAWAEAEVGGCSNQLWMTMAGLREKDHPADLRAGSERHRLGPPAAAFYRSCGMADVASSLGVVPILVNVGAALMAAVARVTQPLRVDALCENPRPVWSVRAALLRLAEELRAGRFRASASAGGGVCENVSWRSVTIVSVIC